MAMGGAICPLAGVTGDRSVRLSFDGIYYVLNTPAWRRAGGTGGGIAFCFHEDLLIKKTLLSF